MISAYLRLAPHNLATLSKQSYILTFCEYIDDKYQCVLDDNITYGMDFSDIYQLS